MHMSIMLIVVMLSLVYAYVQSHPIVYLKYMSFLILKILPIGDTVQVSVGGGGPGEGQKENQALCGAPSQVPEFMT